MHLVGQENAVTGAATARLDAIMRLVLGIPHASWFSAGGDPLTGAERDEADTYLAALGRGDVVVAAVSGWNDAKQVASDPAWDRAWWEEEDRQRAALWRDALGEIPEEALHRALSQVVDAATSTLQGAAAVAATRAGIANAGLIKSAAGAASQACHQAALALAANAGPDHAFAVKLRIFEAGRWPLGIVDGRYFLL